jgi:hypothetical protein
MGHVYRGWAINLMKRLVGGGWGLFDGLIGGAIFAWCYHRLATGWEQEPVAPVTLS